MHQQMNLLIASSFDPINNLDHNNNSSNISPDDSDFNPDSFTVVRNEFHAKWSSNFSTNSTWQDFSEQRNQFPNDIISTYEKNFQLKKKAAPHRPERPSARPVNNNHRQLQYNPVEARKIESLYHVSKTRSARKVLNDNKPSFTRSVDEAKEFFTTVFSEKLIDVDEVKKGLDEFVLSGPVDESLGDPFTPSEVAKKLISLSNSFLMLENFLFHNGPD